MRLRADVCWVNSEESQLHRDIFRITCFNVQDDVLEITVGRATSRKVPLWKELVRYL